MDEDDRVERLRKLLGPVRPRAPSQRMSRRRIERIEAAAEVVYCECGEVVARSRNGRILRDPDGQGECRGCRDSRVEEAEAYLPTPDEIAEACVAIRAERTEEYRGINGPNWVHTYRHPRVARDMNHRNYLR